MSRELWKSNPLQFEVEILGHRKPGLGEIFEIEVPPRRTRYEVECVDLEGSRALVERTDDGPALKGVRSRVISDLKAAPPNRSRSHGRFVQDKKEREYQDSQVGSPFYSLFDSLSEIASGDPDDDFDLGVDDLDEDLIDRTYGEGDLG